MFMLLFNWCTVLSVLYFFRVSHECCTIEVVDDDCAPVNQTVNDTEIWWGNYSNGLGYFVSEPPCLSNYFTVVHRTCEHGNWSREPNCPKLQQPISPCPEDFLYLEDKLTCYKLIEDQTFPPNCPYLNLMSFYDYIFLVKEDFVTGPIWFPARRVFEYGVANIVIVEASRQYGSPVTSTFFTRDSFKKDCLIYHSDLNFESVHCNSTHDAICAYRPLPYAANNFCARSVDPFCMMSDYNISAASCLCATVSEGAQIGTVCDKLAEFNESYQSLILTPNETMCHFGLHITLDGRLLWAKSQEPVKYSYWSKYVNETSGYPVVQSGYGWSYHPSPEVTCAVCEKSIKYRSPSLKLEVNKTLKMLVLTVSFPQSLVLPDKCTVPVFCFSDTMPNPHLRDLSQNFLTNGTVTSETLVTYNFKYSTNYPGYHWCQAFQYPDFRLLSTPKIFVFDEEIHGNEYATTLLIRYEVFENPVILTFFDNFRAQIVEQLEKQYEVVPFHLRYMATKDIDEERRIVEFLIHVTSKVTSNGIVGEYLVYKALLIAATSKIPAIINVTDFLSVTHCTPSATEIDGVSLRWPLTKINVTVTPRELCLQADGSPVTRTCYGDFHNGAQWSVVNGTCSGNPVKSPATDDLYNLLHSGKPFDEVADALKSITVEAPDFLLVDIHFFAEILEGVNKSSVLSLKGITTAVDHILEVPKTRLQEAQDILNSTDRILYNFDALLRNFNRDSRLRNIAITEIVTNNVLVFVFDARHTVIAGIAIFNADGEKTIKVLESDVNVTELLQSEELEVATYIPDSLIAQINKSCGPDEPLMISISVFCNDNLFNENVTDTRSSNSNIFGILLPTIDEEYETLIPVIFKPKSRSPKTACAYWNYGSDELVNTKGEWEIDSQPFTHNRTNLQVCQFAHTTHFALLLLGDLTVEQEKELEENYYGLHVLTVVECSLSVFGILCIFATFVLFKPWRENKGNQILVQFVLVTVLQICLLFISSNIKDQVKHESVCIFVGALLHFSVLSQFCWTLVLAVLNYKRFVLIFNEAPKWILLKACMIGYIFPMCPVLIHVTLFKDNYVVGNVGLCYPAGEGLYIGVLIPGGCIVSANLFIFCIIISNVFRRSKDSEYKQDYILPLRLRLVFVLFFMLGITWLFGFAAELIGGIVLVYLFCITVSLQGFIMFLAFIVFNENTRNMYMYLLKSLRRKSGL